jgi:hypothetical protein
MVLAAAVGASGKVIAHRGVHPWVVAPQVTVDIRLQ